ncbi:hypothetical protein KSP39_PZI022399 [Platanthera zijinensis]|uniref:Uncharacterized protein n=1 Tax=Platanthera zijinensis TaxID=2320716 RepID=A0AAP0AUX2_9ASPA
MKARRARLRMIRRRRRRISGIGDVTRRGGWRSKNKEKRGCWDFWGRSTAGFPDSASLISPVPPDASSASLVSLVRPLCNLRQSALQTLHSPVSPISENPHTLRLCTLRRSPFFDVFSRYIKLLTCDESSQTTQVDVRIYCVTTLCFETNEELISWAQNVTKGLRFVVTIQTVDKLTSRPKLRVVLGCDRADFYRKKQRVALATLDKWMTMSDIRLIIASCYNIAVVHFSMFQSFTSCFCIHRLRLFEEQ